MGKHDMKIVDLPQIPDDVKASQEIIKRGMEDQITGIKLMARLRRAKYEAHLEEGFTEAQALEICKTIEE